MGFRFVPISMTLNELERLQCTTLPYIAFTGAGCGEAKKTDLYYYRQKLWVCRIQRDVPILHKFAV